MEFTKQTYIWPSDYGILSDWKKPNLNTYPRRQGHTKMQTMQTTDSAVCRPCRL